MMALSVGVQCRVGAIIACRSDPKEKDDESGDGRENNKFPVGATVPGYSAECRGDREYHQGRMRAAEPER